MNGEPKEAKRITRFDYAAAGGAMVILAAFALFLAIMAALLK